MTGANISPVTGMAIMARLVMTTTAIATIIATSNTTTIVNKRQGSPEQDSL